MPKEKACKNCHLITRKNICPKCKTYSLSDDFSGIVYILDPAKSKIARELNINEKGKYALKVR
ncbi:MAG: transcription elongation factor subunit Spt4 [Promethearchaeota archaeon]